MGTAQSFFDADELRAATFVRHVEIHDALGSTNDRAAELARQLPADAMPALVAAREQTAGRGRGRKAWWSADGALTFSLLIDPRSTGVLPANWPQLSLATAVAVCDALSPNLEFNPQSQIRIPQSNLGIKWPNDVHIDGRKLCGILIESPGGAAPAKDRLIIGIGINVNNSWQAAPAEAGADGIALCDLTGQEHDLPPILISVLRAIATRIDQLRSRDPDLIQTWQRLNLLAGSRIVVESDGRQIEGECIEIAYDGALVVDTVFGQQRLYSGSVRVTP
jgi:BirA family biotin operon repressor/biotin-[acetyl-CoA-carboxylase] ligase